MPVTGKFVSRGAIFAVLVLMPFSAALAQPAKIKLVPHRAIYDLSLGEVRGNSPVNSARGRIVYDFGGNACDGYTLQSRQVSELDNGEGKIATSDLRSNTWEAGSAKKFKFAAENYLNGKLSDTTDGQAERSANATLVTLTKPSSEQLSVDAGVVFPSEHMVRAITAGLAGTTILNFPVFDGAESSHRVYNTLTLIGKVIAPERKPDDAAASQPALAKLARWPVNISYFDRDKPEKSGEQTPIYTMGFELYENGIARALTIDYNDFVMAGKMTSLEIKEAKPCP
jgi:hypothetical protein